jgi:spore maturation protein CgeB
MKILFTQLNKDLTNLEHSYQRAAETLGHEVYSFHLEDFMFKSPFLKPLLFRMNGFFYLPSTIKKMNVSFTKYIHRHPVDVIFIFCNHPIESASVLYLKSLGIKTVLVWPDPLVNFMQTLVPNIPLYDYIASYSEQSAKDFKLLGSQHSHWIPLAGDPFLHKMPPIETGFQYDISFIGNYRPEREEALAFIIENFKQQKIRILGNWKSVKSKSLKKYVENKHVFGQEYAGIINRTKVNLNIIDDGNYPAANMRFFEIPMAGGFQISSGCPEMETMFKEHEHILYYKSLDQMASQIEFGLSKPEETLKMKQNAHDLILKDHLYTNRVQKILSELEQG